MLRTALALAPLLGACGTASFGASATLPGASLSVDAEVEGPAALGLAGGALLAGAALAQRDAAQAEGIRPVTQSSGAEVEIAGTSATRVETGSASIATASPSSGSSAEVAVAGEAVPHGAEVAIGVAADPAPVGVDVAVGVAGEPVSEGADVVVGVAAEPAPLGAEVAVGGALAADASGAAGTRASTPGQAPSGGVAIGELAFSRPAADVGIEVAEGGTSEAAGARGAAAVTPASGRGSARLGALVSGSVLVDGVPVRLADLAPLAGTASAPPVAATVAGGGLAGEAWVERGAEGPELVVQLRGEPGAVPLARPPLRLSLVIDRSSSMQRVWADVVVAAEALLSVLGPEDEVQVIHYASRGEVVWPMTPLGDGRGVRSALRAGGVGGGTNLEAGLELAYAAATDAPEGARTHVVLLSDGVPNAGAFLPEELAPRAASAREANGCTTTVVGLGGDFDAALLRALATAGGGGYYVGGGSPVARALSAELEASLAATAASVAVQIELPEGAALRASRPVAGARVLASDEGVLHAAVPALAADGTARIVVPLAPGAEGTTRVHLGWKGADGPRAVTLAVDASQAGEATLVAHDTALGRALDVAARHVANGRGAEARAVLELAVGGDLGARRPALRARAGATLRLGVALETLVPTASHVARRDVSLALGALAWGLTR